MASVCLFTALCCFREYEPIGILVDEGKDRWLRVLEYMVIRIWCRALVVCLIGACQVTKSSVGDGLLGPPTQNAEIIRQACTYQIVQSGRQVSWLCG